MPTIETLQARSARRASWLLLVVVAVASTAGRIDPASLTHKTARAADGRLTLEYSVLGHAGTPTLLRLWLATQPEGSPPLVRVNQGYTKLMRIDRVTPQPERVETEGEDVVFVFDPFVMNGSSSIEFEVQSLDYGRRDGSFAVAGSGPVRFTQYVVP